MRLGREVHDDLGRAHERRGDRRVGDVAVDEAMARAVDHVAQVLEPAGVGQLVERGDVPVRMRCVRPADEVGSDEAGAAGDEDLYHRMPTSELSPSMNRYADGRTGSR